MLQLGIHPQDDDDDDITVEQAWDDMVERIKYIFSDEVSSVDQNQFLFYTDDFINVLSCFHYSFFHLVIILLEATSEQHC